MYGFAKLMLDGQPLLEKNPDAFLVLTMIVYRAVRNKVRMRGEWARAGDYATIKGMTRKRYRAAIEHLEEHGYIERRGAKKGTMIKVCDTTVYDISWQKEGHYGAIKPSKEGHKNGQKGAIKGAINGEAQVPDVAMGYDGNGTEKGHYQGQKRAIKPSDQGQKRATERRGIGKIIEVRSQEGIAHFRGLVKRDENVALQDPDFMRGYERWIVYLVEKKNAAPSIATIEEDLYAANLVGGTEAIRLIRYAIQCQWTRWYFPDKKNAAPALDMGTAEDLTEWIATGGV